MTSTSFLIRQVLTANEKPILFGCNDGQEYWIKDSHGGKKRRALINEWLGAALARHLGICVPDWEAVELLSDSFDPDVIQPRGRILTLGLCFGSCNVHPMVDFSDQTINLRSKPIFDQITNPEDFIRIAIFDLWIANGDRNSNNYNLIMKRGLDELTFFAIDHSFMFEDLEFPTIHREIDSFQDEIGSLFGTEAYRKLLKKIGLQRARNVGTGFLNQIDNLTDGVLNGIIDTIPAEWKLSQKERDFIADFLLRRRQGLRIELRDKNLVR